MSRSLRAVIGSDAVTPPKQERSHKTLERIVEALAELLADKTFDEISIQEIAQRAGCAVTSIYARFRDKRAMVPAMHEAFRGDALRVLDITLAAERWRDATPEE